MSPAHRCRAREMGFVSGLLEPGSLNAITDVGGVHVGHVTLHEGSAIRTGVTAVLPHSGNLFQEKVLAAVHTLNGYGKATGLEQVREVGTIETPILVCSTLEVGAVSDAVVRLTMALNSGIGRDQGSVSPLVAECYDGFLNDTRQRSLTREHVWTSIDSAQSGDVPEGAVGAGCGMSGYRFKAGVGTSSRRVADQFGSYTVGALVVLNCGRRRQLLVSGVPVGQALAGWPTGAGVPPRISGGSVIMVLATDAPMSSRQLSRLARRAPLGLARTGAVATHRSGDFVIAFSTAHRIAHEETRLTRSMEMFAENGEPINELFQAAVEATEEAVLNSLCMAETMEGRCGHMRHALPLELVAAMIESRQVHPTTPGQVPPKY